MTSWPKPAFDSMPQTPQLQRALLSSSSPRQPGHRKSIPPWTTSGDLTNGTFCDLSVTLFPCGFSPLRTEDAGEVTKRFIIIIQWLNPVTGVHRSRESIDYLPR